MQRTVLKNASVLYSSTVIHKMARVRGASAKHLANHPVVNSQANPEVTTQWKTVDPVTNGPEEYSGHRAKFDQRAKSRRRQRT